MGLPYPGGPEIDKLAKVGDPHAFEFPASSMQGLNYSFSGLKTSFLYFLRDNLKKDDNFIEKNKADLAASIQYTIIKMLLNKVKRAINETNIKEIAIAGGVSANSGLRSAITEEAIKNGWKTFIPKIQYSTDNAAMIAIAGYFKFLEGDFSSQDVTPYARSRF